MNSTAPTIKRGRPQTPDQLKRQQCNFRLQRWVIDWLESQPEGNGELIEAALIAQHNLTPPDVAADRK